MNNYPTKIDALKLISIAIVLFSGALTMAAEQSASSCRNISQLNLPNADITVAEVVETGKFQPPLDNSSRLSPYQASMYQALPAFCRVAVTLSPSEDSDIKMELWMPADSWNGKYLAVGNGAFTGNIRYFAMADPITRGYATSSTDTGHVGNTASFGLGHPEKIIDFGSRAVHEMTVTSKQIIATYYDRGPSYSYWNGCSAGGRQAMKEAQRFADDFDGIIAGAPGHDWTGRAAAALRAAKLLDVDKSARLSSAKRKLVHQAALNSCDTADGLKDGLISKPQQCNFDPTELQCKGEESASCLTSKQVSTVQLLYSSATNPETGRAITGLLPGSELGWTDLGWTNSARETGMEQFRYLVYADPGWTLDRFNFATDIVKAENTDNDTLNALDPNLKPFFESGGKLIQYHGWSDPQISPSNTTQYYHRVVEEVGSKTDIDDSYRLFMVPGMGHCGGGPGPNSFDMVTALEAWVEKDEAPDSIIAVHLTNGEVDRSRPLCPFPKLAIYTGTGSINEAENFVCRLP